MVGFPSGGAARTAMVLVAHLAAGAACAARAAEPASLLPDRVLGYAPLGEDRRYTADTLFDLIDGGAEVYRAFDVRAVVSRRYGREGAADILADLFDMGSPADAYGVYHHDMRQGPGAGLGRESEADGAAVAFWKDRFFVSISALDDREEERRAVRALARAVADRIEGAGDPPAIVRLLPEEGQDGKRVSYFHDWSYLKTRVDLGGSNSLGIGRDTEGVLAAYRRGGPPPVEYLLLIVRYHAAAKAEAALAAFRAAYIGSADADGVARRDDGRWAGARVAGDTLVAVLEATARPDLERILAEVKRRGGR